MFSLLPSILMRKWGVPSARWASGYSSGYRNSPLFLDVSKAFFQSSYSLPLGEGRTSMWQGRVRPWSIWLLLPVTPSFASGLPSCSSSLLLPSMGLVSWRIPERFLPSKTGFYFFWKTSSSIIPILSAFSYLGIPSYFWSTENISSCFPVISWVYYFKHVTVFCPF